MINRTGPLNPSEASGANAEAAHMADSSGVSDGMPPVHLGE